MNINNSINTRLIFSIMNLSYHIFIHIYFYYFVEWHISKVACGSSINNTLALSREGYVFSFEYRNSDRGRFFLYLHIRCVIIMFFFIIRL